MEKVSGVDETEIAVKLEAHDHEISSLEFRIQNLEVQKNAMQEMALSINTISVSIDNMLRELNQQGKRLKELEKVPVETGKTIKTAVITTLTGSVVGAVVTAVLVLL